LLQDVKDWVERKAIALKLWIGGHDSTQESRKTHNVVIL